MSYFKKILGALFLAFTLLFSCLLLSACDDKGSKNEAKTEVKSEAKAEEKPEAKAEEKPEAKVEDKAKAFHIAAPLVGTGDSIKYFWLQDGSQDGGGLVSYCLYRSLLMPSADLKSYKPDLASSYEISEDGLEYRFVLKDNLKFSDGSLLSLEDVKASIQAALKVSLINGIFPSNFIKIKGAQDFKDGKSDNIEGIAIDGSKMTITLNEPVGVFEKIIGQLLIFPKSMLDKENLLELHNSAFWKAPITSGMFKVGKISAGNFIELVRNEHYEGVAPSIEKIYINFIQNPTLALQDGKSYMYFTNKLDEIKEIKALSQIKEFPIDILFYRYFIANLSGDEGKGESIIADKRVREAILYALDKEQITQALLGGIATPTSTGVPAKLSDFWAEANRYVYNPEKAKELLKEADFDFSKTLKIAYYYSDQSSQDLMAVVANQLKDVGIKTEVINIQSDPTAALFKTRKYDLGYKGLSAFDYEAWYGEYSSNNVNFANITNKNTDFDELINELARSSSEERVLVLEKLQKLEQEKLLKMPFYTIKNFIYINTDKVSLPEGLVFGNPYYQYDFQFEKWQLK